MTDEEMLKQLAGGGATQSAALRHLYQGKGRLFGRFFVGRGGLDRLEADDVLQETVLKILKNASTYGGEGTANSWMWQIARNELNNYYRKNGKEVIWDDEQRKQAEDEESAKPVGERVLQVTDEVDPSRAAELCVTKGLAQFTKKEPERAYAIELVIEGVDGHEIADRIGRSYTATRQYLMQCRKAFAPFIEHCRPLLAT